MQYIPVSNLSEHFYHIRVIVYKILLPNECFQLSGCLGYALKAELAGETLSDPTIKYQGKNTILYYDYDSTKSQRDDPDFMEAFVMAEKFIIEGTPIRKTNRVGKDTKGTRLVDGLGELDMDFEVC